MREKEEEQPPYISTFDEVTQEMRNQKQFMKSLQKEIHQNKKGIKQLNDHVFYSQENISEYQQIPLDPERCQVQNLTIDHNKVMIRTENEEKKWESIFLQHQIRQNEKFELPVKILMGQNVQVGMLKRDGSQEQPWKNVPDNSTMQSAKKAICYNCLQGTYWFGHKKDKIEKNAWRLTAYDQITMEVDRKHSELTFHVKCKNGQARLFKEYPDILIKQGVFLPFILLYDNWNAFTWNKKKKES